MFGENLTPFAWFVPCLSNLWRVSLGYEGDDSILRLITRAVLPSVFLIPHIHLIYLLCRHHSFVQQTRCFLTNMLFQSFFFSSFEQVCFLAFKPDSTFANKSFYHFFLLICWMLYHHNDDHHHVYYHHQHYLQIMWSQIRWICSMHQRWSSQFITAAAF